VNVRLASWLILPAILSSLIAQDFSVNVPSSVLRRIGRVLPERSNAGAPFLSESYDSSLTFAKAGTARIIFLHEAAGYQNSLGYFTYTDNVDGSITVTSSDLLIANVSEPGSVRRGDGYDLLDQNGSIRTFQPGEKLGFFLIADGNRQASPIINGWTYGYSDGLGQVPSSDPAINQQRALGCYTSLSRLNPEVLAGAPDKARHLAMLRMPGQGGFLGGEDYILCGWEDLQRTGNSDDDFNDVLFVVDLTPVDAVLVDELFRYEDRDPDGDGVHGLNDAFPNDAARASLERIPSTGCTMLAYEDKYPTRGDSDYNDAVFAYVFELVTDANGNIKDILGTVSLVARGASYDASFGLHLPGLPPTATGTIRIERFVSGAATSTVAATRTLQSIITNGTRRIPDVVDSTVGLLPAPAGYEFSNTLFASGIQSAGSARVHIEFDQPIPPGVLGPPPYDAFLYVANPNYPGARIDIYLPGWSAFPDRPSNLPDERGLSTFVDDGGFPWALEVPSGWRFPMELVEIETAYPGFRGWRLSSGRQNRAWYESPDSSTGYVGASLSELIPARTWTVRLPR
jgi:LruC domain-containing protein